MFEKTVYKIAELQKDNTYVQEYWEKPSASSFNKIVRNTPKGWMVFI